MFLFKWIEHKRIDIPRSKEELKQLLDRGKDGKNIDQTSEKELISLEYEKLRGQKIQQDKEQANLAMNLVRKNEFLIKTMEELQNLRKAAKEENIIEKIDSIISSINREVDQNKQRKVFDLAFDEVHEKFMNRLKSQYPALTPTELRLCAFLKMNISTKEVAQLMNISVRGVEICRYRVRKKLNIDRTTNLTSLLINF